MKKYLIKNQTGFTLIEVVLVLAIGGLIFLLAFLAFRQVSINRRDTQRRNDAGRIVAELQNYTANGGSYNSFRSESLFRISSPDSSPADACGTDTDPFIASFTRVYLCKDGQFRSPAGTNYVVVGITGIDSSTVMPTVDNSIFFINIDCNNSSGKASIRIKLEKGTAVCRDI